MNEENIDRVERGISAVQGKVNIFSTLGRTSNIPLLSVSDTAPLVLPAGNMVNCAVFPGLIYNFLKIYFYLFLLFLLLLLFYFYYYTKHCLICRLSDSTTSEDATLSLACSQHARLDIIQCLKLLFLNDCMV